MFQDLREVCDHGEGKVEICLAKKMWASIRIAFLLGLVFRIMQFMQKLPFLDSISTYLHFQVSSCRIPEFSAKWKPSQVLERN